MKSARTPGANAVDWQAAHIDEARYQHMTVRVLGVMAAIAAAFTVLAGAGLFVSSIPPDTFAGLFLLSVFFYAGWRAAAKGHWRTARHIPAASIFIGALYGNYIGGMGAPAVLMYVLAVVLSAMLQGRSARVLVFAASLTSYSTLAVLHHLDILTAIRSDETAFLNRILIAASAFIAIAAALRYLIGRLEDSIALSIERGNELAAANEEMQATVEELEATMEEFEAQNEQLVKVNRALESSEERFSRAFHTSPAPMVISDINTGHFIDANEQWLRLSGHTRDETIGRTSFELGIWDDPGLRIQMREKILIDGSLREIPLRVITKSGEKRDTLWSAEIITFAGQRAMLSLIYDYTERRRAEEALRLEEERLNTLLELNLKSDANESELTHFAMESAVKLTGSAIGYIAFVNGDESVLTMFAWSQSAMRECAVADKPITYPVRETGLWGEAIRQRRAVITNDYAAPNPWKKGMPDGHVAVVRHVNVPIFDGDRIVIVAGVGNKATDYGNDDLRQLTLLMSGLWSIIRRKRAEDQLRQSEERLRTIGDNLPGGIIYQVIREKDGSRRFTYLSAGVKNLHGHTLEEVVADASLLYRQVHPDDSEAMAREEKKTFDELAVSDFEARFIVGTGEIRWYRLVSRPRLLENGDIIADGIEIDITDRKRSEEEIKNLYLQMEQKVLARTEELRSANEGLTAANTALQETLIELEQAQNQLVQSEKLAALGQIAAGMAHELNTPLGAIISSNRSLMELIRDKLPALTRFLHGLTDDEHRMFEALLDEGLGRPLDFERAADRKTKSRIKSLLKKMRIEDDGGLSGAFADLGIDDTLPCHRELLAHARRDEILAHASALVTMRRLSGIIDLGAEKASHVVGALKSYLRREDDVDDARVDLRVEIETLLTLYHGKLKYGVEVLTRFPAGATLVIGNRNRLNQVWINLINNALQAMEYRGRLSISAERSGQWILVSFGDTGAGIPEAIRDRVFEPFFTTKKHGEGIGLGLDIARSIVEGGGGRIELESVPGSTVFRVYLRPADDPDRQPLRE